MPCSAQRLSETEDGRALRVECGSAGVCGAKKPDHVAAADRSERWRARPGPTALGTRRQRCTQETRARNRSRRRTRDEAAIAQELESGLHDRPTSRVVRRATTEVERRSAGDVEDRSVVGDLTNVHVEEVAWDGHRAPSIKSNGRSDQQQSKHPAGHQTHEYPPSVGPLQGPEGPLTSVGAIVEHTKPATGPISPELVLVDPDLAAGARAALPDSPWPAPVRIEPREPTRHRGEPTRHRRIPVAATFSFLSFAALVGILGVSLLPARDQPTFAAEGQRTLPAAPSTTTGVSRHRAAPSPTTEVSPQPAAPQSKNPSTQRTGGARRSPVRKPVPSGKRTLPRFRPTRTFAWVSQAGAAYYQVAFFRNGRRFYQRRTRSARVTVPRRVRFAPGDYRWTVRPAFRVQDGVRLADPIVDSTFRTGRD